MVGTSFGRKRAQVSPENGYRVMTYDSLCHLRLHSKPRCPWCGKPMVHLYGDFPSGTICIKCRTCGNLAVVSFPEFRIEKVVSE